MCVQLIRTLCAVTLARDVFCRVFDHLFDIGDDRPVVTGSHSLDAPEGHRFRDPVAGSVACFISLHAREIRKVSAEDAGCRAGDPPVDSFTGGLFFALTAAKEIRQVELIGQGPSLQTLVILARSLTLHAISSPQDVAAAPILHVGSSERRAPPRRLAGNEEQERFVEDGPDEPPAIKEERAMQDAMSSDVSREKNIIEVMDGGVHVRSLLISRSDVASYLRAIPEEDRVVAFIHAVEVGVFSLQRARAGADMDFVRRELDTLLARVHQVVGGVPAALEARLVERIGTADGQVLAPVQALVRGVSEVADRRVAEIKDLFGREIDPGKESSTLGAALKALRELVDPKRKDSIQASLDSALQNVASRDGALASAIRDVVTDAVKPLKEEIDSLSKEVQRQHGEAAVIARTTEKGAPFEEEIVARLQPWARFVGAEVYYVGSDKHPGDIVIELKSEREDGSAVRLVIEAKAWDNEKARPGRSTIGKSLNTAMIERDATLALYLSRSHTGLAREIGEWAEGACERGLFVVTTEEHLTTAIRFLLVQHRLATSRAAKRQIDMHAV